MCCSYAGYGAGRVKQDLWWRSCSVLVGILPFDRPSSNSGNPLPVSLPQWGRNWRLCILQRGEKSNGRTAKVRDPGKTRTFPDISGHFYRSFTLTSTVVIVLSPGSYPSTGFRETAGAPSLYLSPSGGEIGGCVSPSGGEIGGCVSSGGGEIVGNFSGSY